MGKIYVIMSADSNELAGLCQYEHHSFEKNEKLCKLLKSTNHLNYIIWNFYRNNGTPSEIEKSLLHFLILFEDKQIKNVVILTNNIFVLSYINSVIKSTYITKDNFIIYTYSKKKFIKEKITDDGIIPKYLLKEYKKKRYIFNKLF